MLTKKLKKIAKECRKAEDPVLEALAAYVEFVVDYLGRAKDEDPRAKEYGAVLGRLDLSEVVNVREGLFAAAAKAEPEAAGEQAEQGNAERKASAKKSKKKRAKAEGDAEGASAETLSPAAGEEVLPAEADGEMPRGKKGKKGKKDAKKNSSS